MSQALPIARHSRRARKTDEEEQRRYGMLWPLYAVLALLSLLFAFPYFWSLSSSLKTAGELIGYPPTWFPETPQFINYVKVLTAERAPFPLWMWNSVTLAVLSTTGTVLSASLVAYSFARFRYRGRDLIFLITLGTMMLPGQVTLIPTFILFFKIGWVNSWNPLWIPAWFGGGAFNIFLMRQFILSLPLDLDDAATIDGASYWRIFWNILLPLCKPAIATMAVLRFMGSWNDFLGPVIYLDEARKFTIAVGLHYFRWTPDLGGARTDNLMMAGAIISTLPMIVLFFSAQRYFVRGLALTGIKA